MEETESVDVPANQKVDKVLKIITNKSFARKAAALKPDLHEWVDHPLPVIKF
jgi:hypothetical protein